MTKKTKRIILWCVGIYFGICLVYAVYSFVTEPETSEVAATESVVSEKVNPEDDAALMRCKNLYSKLMSFKDNPSFHTYGFGEGGDSHGWYMAAHNFTKEDDVHLMQTYGIVSGDLLMLAEEYIKSKGKETEYSKGKRQEFENAFSGQSLE